MSLDIKSLSSLNLPQSLHAVFTVGLIRLINQLIGVWSRARSTEPNCQGSSAISQNQILPLWEKIRPQGEEKRITRNRVKNTGNLLLGTKPRWW